jgi:hypothetical protein
MKTYCEILYPGSFFPEEEVIEVKTRQPEAIAKKYPGAFAFQFFDQVKQEVEVDGVKRTVSGDRKNLSPKYFPGGKTFDKQEVEAMGPEFRILRSNMDNDGWGIVVKTRRGNFQPFTKDCALIA